MCSETTQRAAKAFSKMPESEGHRGSEREKEREREHRERKRGSESERGRAREKERGSACVFVAESHENSSPSPYEPLYVPTVLPTVGPMDNWLPGYSRNPFVIRRVDVHSEGKVELLDPEVDSRTNLSP